MTTISIKKPLTALATALLLSSAFASASVAETVTPVATEAPAGAYTLDKAHSTITFRINHLGFSNFTAQFSRIDAKLQLDPAKPAEASIEATIDAKSLELTAPPAGFLEDLIGAKWLNTEKFPEMTFKSTKVEMTSPNTATITGGFTMLGVTKPVVLDATFNGGYAGHQYDPFARIGFSAKGSIKRSEYGLAYGIPEPGTTMGVSDNIDVVIESEFNGPAWANAPATPPTPPAQ